MGYYIEQIENNYKADWNKATEELNNTVNAMYNTFKSILEENTFPSKVQEKWKTMTEKKNNARRAHP